MNDNFFPKNVIVVTQSDKEEFLQNLHKHATIDPGIESVVNLTNDMPYFLTQSSCEGKGSNPYSKHLPTPYLSIGVLYEGYGLLDELFNSIFNEMKRKTLSISYDYEVQAVNQDHTGFSVPRFHKFLTVFLKNKRGIVDFEELLKRFSEKKFTINTNESEIKDELIGKNLKLLNILNQLIQSKHIPMQTTQVEQDIVINRLKELLSNCHATLNVKVAFENRNPMYPPHYSVRFTLKGTDHNIDELYKILCSVLKGGIIASQHFIPTDAGFYLRDCIFTIFDSRNIELILAVVEDWVDKGTWNIM
jgi:hypothetical protein